MSPVFALSGMHLSILVLSLLGFCALAFATERHAKHLLGRMPAPGWRRMARVAGWLLLFVALAQGIAALGSGVGITLWLGWLSIAALALVFALPKWPWQPPVRENPARNRPRDDAGQSPAVAVSRSRRWVAAGLLAATVAVFAIALLRVEPQPLQREDAIQGTLGPWSFTLAEADRNAPEVVDMDVPIKAFRLRFCEACDADIRHAYLKVNKPRSMRAAGMAFEGARWEREVEIQLPANLQADSELWLTVVGKDGSVHQAAWSMERVSPATVAWFDRQRSGHANR
ncbi:DUF3325 domain-containing protein [Thauera linaloolentis]|uniref:DUF3325 domain-containing protein n=1 Tax=Thauera linaloolentis (strain DSM 12138 / JCM 21573 / CCUG 41526 / CIP 105981 / IAM 15112 / NBRC 102519 / 47Lol) TaxID=1123367 RepID=N6YG26_THAL4|nr:DUF3325 domain-containing protein [Thauera linaloolentis]ENO90445.1 hypothetical protein C666_01035 [Thauera linaloolentis 47Lol = DSM 12138]MCM8566306.1 DUF3325 domain-containing protein [Thauera linaloolentis]